MDALIGVVAIIGLFAFLFWPAFSKQRASLTTRSMLNHQLAAQEASMRMQKQKAAMNSLRSPLLSSSSLIDLNSLEWRA